jgi:hypothetical protein
MRIKNFCLAVLAIVMLASLAAGQEQTGGLKGKVKVAKGSPGGVSVVVQQGEREVTHGTTTSGGDFTISGLAPGIYGLTLRKPGLSVSTIEKISVRAGKVTSLGDRLYLPIDEGSIAFIKGSVFNGSGRSFPGARVELARVLEDGSLKKVDSRVTNDLGEFNFRIGFRKVSSDGESRSHGHRHERR